MKEEQPYSNILSSWQGAWISVNGNPDIYILRAYDGNYYLLAYSYDKESGRGSFSLYDIDLDESGYFANIGMKPCKITSEEHPYGLYIAGWGSYMKD
ncbi:DUF3876 domain-containing protein [Dysgonomonas sp. 25]|uniref:DUF3876 domain-containing protein n=1 Tax=Dysgonomonas sp. 25 TaxID=2302933 RepID=UPI0013D78E8A|nr:DUF3876 domain-containing protein [Dysgonomonas sp. 25]NDV68291.1 DUF3876 domain-containing protein [Dysgonomonas sp. 25]